MVEVHPIEHPATAQWDLPLKHAEYTKLLKGFQPQDMDDRWLVIADTPKPDAQGNTTVRFYRSWTREEQISLDIVAGDPNKTEADGWAKVVKISWNKQPGFLGTEEEAKNFAASLYKGILRRIDSA